MFEKAISDIILACQEIDPSLKQMEYMFNKYRVVLGFRTINDRRKIYIVKVERIDM